MNVLKYFGSYVIMLRSLFHKPENAAVYWKELFRQMNSIGIESIPIIAVVSLFIGAVTALQFAYQMNDFPVPMYYIGFIVRDSMMLEMSPTVSCMILAGKVGSNMASELGNMRISNQIDALDIMGVNSTTYLIATKIIGAILTIPLLVIISVLLGILGGLVACVSSDLIPLQQFDQGLHAFYLPSNVNLMLVKSVVFSFILSSVACFEGYYVKGGAIEIGAAATRAVVLSNILILFFDYLIASIMLK